MEKPSDRRSRPWVPVLIFALVGMALTIAIICAAIGACDPNHVVRPAMPRIEWSLSYYTKYVDRRNGKQVYHQIITVVDRWTNGVAISTKHWEVCEP